MARNLLKLNGSLLFVTVFGGARPEGFPVTPPKTPVSFRFPDLRFALTQTPTKQGPEGLKTYAHSETGG